MSKVLKNIKLFVVGLVIVSILFMLIGICGKFLGAYGMFVGIGLSALVVAILLHFQGDKVVEAVKQDET